MVYTTHLWWLGGWFIIAIPTLQETSKQNKEFIGFLYPSIQWGSGQNSTSILASSGLEIFNASLADCSARSKAAAAGLPLDPVDPMVPNVDNWIKGFA